jgi:purine-binding chemotaxis protein CheW
MTEEVYEEEGRYLLFKLGNELYGSPLLGIREVVEPQETKPIPNTSKYFVGVINIRGKIVGVVDLRTKLTIDEIETKEMALLVFDTEAGPMAGLVDKVEAVVRISSSEIEKKPSVKTTVPIDFMIGIAKEAERLITLIDLNRMLGADELVQIKNMMN